MYLVRRPFWASSRIARAVARGWGRSIAPVLAIARRSQTTRCRQLKRKNERDASVLCRDDHPRVTEHLPVGILVEVFEDFHSAHHTLDRSSMVSIIKCLIRG